MSIVAGISAVLALIGGVIAFDSRYAKETDIVEKLTNAKSEIISEMRREVVKNRSVMIAAMQREADDLEYQITQLTAAGTSVPRYMSDKHRQIIRQIKELKDEDSD